MAGGSPVRRSLITRARTCSPVPPLPHKSHRPTPPPPPRQSLCKRWRACGSCTTSWQTSCTTTASSTATSSCGRSSRLTATTSLPSGWVGGMAGGWISCVHAGAPPSPLALPRTPGHPRTPGRQVFALFDIKQNSVIEFGEFVRSLSVFHPKAPLEAKARCEWQCRRSSSPVRPAAAPPLAPVARRACCPTNARTPPLRTHTPRAPQSPFESTTSRATA